ncbi:MAG: radical SAM protein [Spirochaetales bacterium]
MSPDALRFERIYVERDAADHPEAKRIVSLFTEASIVLVDYYGEVFHRRRQSFQLEKRNPALILAVARGQLLYEATSRIAERSSTPTYYTDQLRNCPFNCDYCFLQGMHQSGYPLVFVNSEDYLKTAHERSLEGPCHLTVSFLTDALAFEPLIPSVATWVAFANDHPSMTIEVRTKSRYASLLPLPPVNGNVLVTWTLSPEEVTKRYERGAATLEQRLAALEYAAKKGWRVGIAIDPVLLVREWRSAYQQLLSRLETLELDVIESVSYGVFRMNHSFLETMQAARGDTPILHHPFTREGSLRTYTSAEIDAIRSLMEPKLIRLFGPERVAFIHG